MSLGNIAISITIDKEYAKDLQKAEKECQAFAKNVEKSLSKSLSKSMAGVSSTLKSVGNSVSGLGKEFTKLSAPIIGLGASALYTASQFDEIFSGTAAIAKAGGSAEEDITALKDTILDFGSKGVFSVQEVALAVDDMVKDGLDPATISTTQLKAAYDLAAAAGEGLSASQVALSDTMQAFAADTDEAQKYADAFANFLNITPGSLTDFSEALKPVGPLAASNGIAMEDLSAALALLAQNGIRGGEAGTSLKRILLNLTSPTTAIADVMDDLGLKVYDTAGNMKPLNTILGDLSKSLEGATQEEKNFVLTTIGGAYGVTGLNVLLNEGTDQFDKYAEAMRETGSAEKIAADRTKGLFATMKRLGATIQTSLIKVGLDESLGGLVQTIVDKVLPIITKLADTFVKLPKPVKLIIIGIAGFVAILGPLLVILGTVITAIGTVVGALGTLVGFISAPVIVIGVLIGAFVALGGAFIVLAKKFGLLDVIFDRVKLIYDKIVITIQNIREAFEDPKVQAALNKLKGAFNTLVESVRPIFDTLISLFHTLFGEMDKTFGDDSAEGFLSVEDAVNILAGAFEWLASKIEQAQPTIDKVVEFISGIITKVQEAVLAFQSFRQDVIDAFQSPEVQTALGEFKTLMDELKPITTELIDAVKGLFGAFKSGDTEKTNEQTKETVTTLDKLKKAFTTIIGIVKFFVSVMFTIIKAVTTVINIIATVITFLLNLGKTFLNIATSIAQFVVSLPAYILQVLQAIVQFISNAIQAIINFFTVVLPTAIANGINAAIEWVKSLPEKVIEMANNIGLAIHSVIEFFKSLPERIAEWIAKFVADVKAKFTETKETASNTISEMVTAIIEWFKSLPEKISTWLSTTYENIKTKFTEMKDSAILKIKEMIESIKTFIAELPEKMKEWLENLKTAAVEKFDELKETAKNFGKDFVQSLIDGLKQKWEDLKGWVNNVKTAFSEGLAGKKTGENKMYGGLVGFMRGGIVNAMRGLATSGTDSVLAALTEGEIVMPRYMSSQFTSLLKRMGSLSGMKNAGISSSAVTRGLSQGVNVNIDKLNASSPDEGRRRGADIGFGLFGNLRAKGLV